MRKLLQISSLALCILFSNALISPLSIQAKPKNKKLKKLYCEDNDSYFQSNEIVVKFKAKKADFEDLHNAETYINEKLKQTTRLEHIGQTSKAKSERLKRSLGINRSYRVILEDLNSDPNLISCHQLVRAVKRLKRDSNISSVSPSYIFKTNAVTNDPLVTSHGDIWTFSKDELYGHKKINAPQAWDHAAGEGVVVAIIDTGIDYNHPDLWKNIWVNPKLASDINEDGLIDLDDVDLNQNHRIDPEEIRPGLIGRNIAYGNDDPYDSKNGHGTHIAGTIAAVGNNNLGIAGVAYKAKILPIKAMNDEGYAPFTKLAEAIIYATDMGADVINNSWNCDCEAPEIIRDAFEYSHRQNVINIMSAGNLRKELEVNSPAALNTTISVASTEFFDYRSSFSNYGALIDIAAPGTSILSTLAQSAHQSSLGGVRLGMDNNFDYWYISGTSMAAAMASGAAAVIKSANPKLNNEEIRRILKTHARQLDTFDQNLGAGLINLEASVLDAINLKEAPVLTKKASGEILISPANPQVNELVKIEFRTNTENLLNSFRYSWNTDADSHIEGRSKSFFVKYPQAGAITIKLELRDQDGNSELINKEITVSAGRQINQAEENSNQASFLIRDKTNGFAKLRRNQILSTKFFLERTLSSLGKNLLLKVEVDSEYADLVKMNVSNTKFIANNKNNFRIRLRLKSRRKFKKKLRTRFSNSNKLTIPVKITDLTSNYSITQNLVVYL